MLASFVFSLELGEPSPALLLLLLDGDDDDEDDDEEEEEEEEEAESAGVLLPRTRKCTSCGYMSSMVVSHQRLAARACGDNGLEPLEEMVRARNGLSDTTADAVFKDRLLALALLRVPIEPPPPPPPTTTGENKWWSATIDFVGVLSAAKSEEAMTDDNEEVGDSGVGSKAVVTLDLLLLPIRLRDDDEEEDCVVPPFFFPVSAAEADRNRCRLS